MAWGRVGVGLSTGQQTPTCFTCLTRCCPGDGHRLSCAWVCGHRGSCCQEVARGPSTVLEGWVCSGKITWLLPAAPGQHPGAAPPCCWAACASLLVTPPQLLEGRSGTICASWGPRATAQLSTSLHCPLAPHAFSETLLGHKPRSPSPRRPVPSLAPNPTSRLKSFEGAPLPLTPLTSFPSSSTAPPLPSLPPSLPRLLSTSQTLTSGG